MTIVENRTLITGGVDTHLKFQVAAATLDPAKRPDQGCTPMFAAPDQRTMQP